MGGTEGVGRWVDLHGWRGEAALNGHVGFLFTPFEGHNAVITRMDK